ncbi:MAG: HD domain-containing protein, partial [Ruminococcus sp.]|nr:HD domain-containing protein [Ruminococcus sp.]
WFASLRLGLLRLSRSAITDVFADNGIAPSVVNTTAVYGNMLYAGTDDGLCIIDMRTHKLIENELTEILRGSRIRSLQPSRDGGLWVCSYGVGLVKTDITGAADNWSDRIKDMGTRVRVCTELSDGTIAVSSSEGIFLIKDSRQTKSFRYGGEIGYSQVLCFLEAQDGTLLAGTDGSGIFMIKDGRVIRHISRDDGLPSEVILRMVKDPEDGSVFIVTSNSICRMAGDKVTELTAFPYSNNYDVMIDDDGELFIPGSAGIYVVDKHKLISGDLEEIALLDMRSGLPGSLTANAWNGSDGKCVYLSADRGVYKVDLDGYLLSRRAFRLTIPQIKLDDRSITPERGSVITVGREVAKIEFFPELINYTFADPVVSYRLDGFDPDWVDLKDSELLSIPYTNLPPGDYTFRLAVRDENGMISEESTYSLTKEKAIYDNIWFKYYMIAVAVVFIGWLTWFITRTQVQRTLEIQQAKLSMALQQVQMGNETILAIAKTVDAKDERTSQHSQRVSEYSAMIAREYGFTEAEQENIRKAALLHDIGKIGIPDSVLNKPGRLTDDEYAIMKTHVTRGAEILKDLTLIDHVVEGARYHHERYDGRGYPDGLKGEDIPLYGRIIAIADAFDAMTANRVYRKRQDFDYVMGELHKGRGTQFDPELLDIFLKLIDDKKIDIDALYSNDPAKEE